MPGFPVMTSLSVRSPMFGRLLLVTGLLAFCFAILLARPAAAATDEAERAAQFIETLASDALRLLGDADRGMVAREGRVRELMNRHVAIDFIARFGLGERWNGLEAVARDEYVALFREFFLDRYAGMLGGYRGQTLTVTGVREAREGDLLVDTEVTEANGEAPLVTAWRVRRFDGHLQIIDIVVEGVSVAVNQRQEFASVIGRSGFDGLLERLRARKAV